MIPLNKPFLSEKEILYINECLVSGHTSGDGYFTSELTELICNRYSINKLLLTSSCTDALEMIAMLLDLKYGDEIIAPSYTFVSTVIPFIPYGVKIVFADCCTESPHITADTITDLITKRTKAIILVHYAGIGCEIDKIRELIKSCVNQKIYLIEDSAQAINSFYCGKALGTFGELSCYSFHESKNISSGEGGAIIVNDLSYFDRAEIIREKGTNRSKFFRGEVEKYGWVDLGSSHLMSDILAAKLKAQFECIEDIQTKRDKIFSTYMNAFHVLKDKDIQLPVISDKNRGNSHIFYLVLQSLSERDNFISYMRDINIFCTFHYQSLHKSKYFNKYYCGKELFNSDKYTNCLVRLPIFPDLTESQISYIIDSVLYYFKSI